VDWEALHSLNPFLLLPVFLLSCLLPAVCDFGFKVFHEVLRLRLGERGAALLGVVWASESCMPSRGLVAVAPNLGWSLGEGVACGVEYCLERNVLSCSQAGIVVKAVQQQDTIVRVEAAPEECVAFLVYQHARVEEGLCQVHEPAVILGHLAFFGHGELHRS
jgi:hypothetical protein